MNVIIPNLIYQYQNKFIVDPINTSLAVVADLPIASASVLDTVISNGFIAPCYEDARTPRTKTPSRSTVARGVARNVVLVAEAPIASANVISKASLDGLDVPCYDDVVHPSIALFGMPSMSIVKARSAVARGFKVAALVGRKLTIGLNTYAAHTQASLNSALNHAHSKVYEVRTASMHAYHRVHDIVFPPTVKFPAPISHRRPPAFPDKALYDLVRKWPQVSSDCNPISAATPIYIDTILPGVDDVTDFRDWVDPATTSFFEWILDLLGTLSEIFLAALMQIMGYVAKFFDVALGWIRFTSFSTAPFMNFFVNLHRTYFEAISAPLVNNIGSLPMFAAYTKA